MLILLTLSSTFVNGRSREVIMEEMRNRIDRGDVDKEIEETIQVDLTLMSLSRRRWLLLLYADVVSLSCRPCVILQRTERRNSSHKQLL